MFLEFLAMQMHGIFADSGIEKTCPFLKFLALKIHAVFIVSGIENT
jgi:hypothetical protein